MNTLLTFLCSTSGYVEPQQGLSLGWLSLALGGLAVFLGPAKAKADCEIFQCQGQWIPCDENWYYKCYDDDGCEPYHEAWGWAKYNGDDTCTYKRDQCALCS